jgi:hypothetical protein
VKPTPAPARLLTRRATGLVGTGSMLLDERRRPDGSLDALCAPTFLFLPLLPLRVLRLREALEPEASAGFELVGSEPAPAARALRLYVRALAGLAAALAPAWATYALAFGGSPLAGALAVLLSASVVVLVAAWLDLERPRVRGVESDGAQRSSKL